VAEKVKIYEIAKNLGIKSSELVEICQRAGFPEISHHSNAVEPEKADEIRRTAIKKYRPKEEPAPKKPLRAEKKRPKKKESEKKKPVPSAKAVRPVPPPAPRGKEAPVRASTDLAEPLVVQVAKPRGRSAGKLKPARREKPAAKKKKETLTKRTIVFKQAKKPPVKRKEEKIKLSPPVTVRVLSEKLGIGAGEILKDLMFKHNLRTTINQTLDEEMVELIALEHDVEIVFEVPKTAEDLLLDSLPEDKPEDLRPRPPVVALLGHVDHGKTTILDRVRHTDVAGTEEGGITQDIGAWQITHDGHRLTFIDTPGHEAFTAMRARGAQVTDLVVLVVAADDGVMPQTQEAIDHARAAGVPIVVAINKVDKPEADAMGVRRQLAALGLNPEEWGGQVGCVEVSGLTGEGIDDLLERIALEAELLELKANPDRKAKAVVLEARKQEGLGVVASLIVQNGALALGDAMVCGVAYGRARSMFDQSGREVAVARPSDPVAVSGLDRVPEAGHVLLAVDDLDTARQIAQERLSLVQRRKVTHREHVTLENLYERLAAGVERQLKVIVKADVQGSLEPLAESLERLRTGQVGVNILHQGVGDVNESDILLADASDAVIIAFRVGTRERAKNMAGERGVQVRSYRVIYNVIEQVKSALEGFLEPEQREEKVGVAEVRRLFRISRIGTIAGCYVSEGSIRRDCNVRVMRDGELLHEGSIASLRREKEDVREVESGYECGIRIEGFDKVEVGDALECFEILAVKQTLP